MSRIWIGSRGALLAALLGVVAASRLAALEPVDKTFLGGLAAEGYDAVAYFTDGRAVEGSKAFETTWNGATWRFASEAHRQLFQKEPARYAPQFGGYCAWAVSQGYTASGDPQAWTIVGGKLYLNYDAEVQEIWQKDPAGYIKQANGKFAGLLKN